MGLKELFDYRNYHVDYRLDDIMELEGIAKDFDLIVLDRDGTTGGYHASQPDGRFVKILEKIKGKSEMVSNSSYDTMIKINEIYGDLMPVAKLVRVGIFASIDDDEPDDECDILFRFVDKSLRAYEVLDNRLMDCTDEFCTKNVPRGFSLGYFGTKHQYKKPDPRVLEAVVDLAKQEERIPKDNPRVLMVGDKYCMDVACGNRAGFKTAKVKTQGQLSDLKEGRVDYILGRVLFDTPFGWMMSKIAEMRR